MEQCPKCEGKEISVEYQAKGKETGYNLKIDDYKKFMRDDTYYYSDKVKKEHLVYKCERCSYKKATQCKDNN